MRGLSVIGMFADSGSTGDGTIDAFLVVTGLLGGLALFLLGMDRMTGALRIIAGDRMRGTLERLTRNRFTAAATGAGVTAVIQSSSVTTVLVVGFISAGLMSLEQSIGVIMGANVGTTITAQIIAFNVSRYALSLIAVGFGVRFFSKGEKRRSWGSLVLGLGMVFFGMTVMSESVAPLRGYEPFQDWMAGMSNPIAGIIAGALFTAVVQSSSATTGVVLALAFEGLIDLEAGIALVLGANIGTSVTAQLAAIGKPREAQRAAWVHTLFNTIGVLIWIPLIPVLAGWVESIGGGLAREIANAHTIFNIANLFVFIWFTGVFARVVEKLVPDRPDAPTVMPKYLDDGLLRTPSIALDRARLEILRLSERVRNMLAESGDAVLSGSNEDLVNIEAMDDEVDSLYASIVDYLGRLSKGELLSHETDELFQLMEATNNLEAIGDIIETNLVQLGLARIENELVLSPESQDLVQAFHWEVLTAYELAMLAVTQKNEEAAHRCAAMKSTINSMARKADKYQASRLVSNEANRVDSYAFETDVVAHLKRIYWFTRRTARIAIPASRRSDD